MKIPWKAWAVSALLALPAGAQVRDTGTFVHLSISDVNSLDPAYGGDATSGLVVVNLYETLFAYDGASTGTLIPLLAEKIPSRENGLISPDGLVYSIPIRKGVRFHDGSPLEPEDVRYSLMRQMIMDAGPGEYLLEPLTGRRFTHEPDGALRGDVYRDVGRAVSVEGDAVVLRLAAPSPLLPQVLARWSYVVSKKWAVARGDWDGGEATWTRYNNPRKEDSPFLAQENGTGPFRLELWNRAAREVVLARNEDYWREPARLKRVVVRASSELGTRKLQLAAGDADAIEADRGGLSQLQGLPGVQVLDGLPQFVFPAVMHFCFNVNPRANPYIGSGRLDGEGIPGDFFADRDVRLGFAYAFDYEGFRRDIYGAQAIPAHGFVPEGMLGHDPAQKTYELDLARAERHLRQARGGEIWRRGFRLKMAYKSGSLERQAAAQILKRSLERMNPKFKVDVIGLDTPALMDGTGTSRIPIGIGHDDAPFMDPHAFAFPLMHSDPTDSCKYRNEAADRLIDAARAEPEPARRESLYRRLMTLGRKEAIQPILIEARTLRVQRSWVKGYSYNPMLPNGSDFYSMSKEASGGS